MTSKQTEPLVSSMFGWKILFMKPMEGDLYGYWSCSSTWIFQVPPAKGAARERSERARGSGVERGVGKGDEYDAASIVNSRAALLTF